MASGGTIPRLVIYITVVRMAQPSIRSAAPAEALHQAVVKYLTQLKTVQKRSGKTEAFDADKLARSLKAAMVSGGMRNAQMERRVI